MRLRDRLQRFMYGRYGNDQLSTFCFAAFAVIWLVSMLFRGTWIGTLLTVIDYLIVLTYFFRFFSRNIVQRQKENRIFLSVKNRIKNFFKFQRLRFVERNGVKKLYRCPKCHQVIRVPKGRGKIAITCPKCHFEFIKKT